MAVRLRFAGLPYTWTKATLNSELLKQIPGLENIFLRLRANGCVIFADVPGDQVDTLLSHGLQIAEYKVSVTRDSRPRGKSNQKTIYRAKSLRDEKEKETQYSLNERAAEKSHVHDTISHKQEPKVEMDILAPPIVSSIPLIDIGINLNHRSFSDIRGVVRRASLAGVRGFVSTGTCLRSSTQLAESHHTWQTMFPEFNFKSTAGVHPHNAKHWTPDVAAKIERLVQQECVVAVGETGLDFNRNFSSRQEQEYAFRAQLEIACRSKKPLFCHERDAHERFLAIIDEFGESLPPIIVHCFTGTCNQAEVYIQRGFYLGVTGFICKRNRGESMREFLSVVPISKLMVETDAPFMIPEHFNLKNYLKSYQRASKVHNEPCSLPIIVQAIAESMQTTSEEIARATTENAERFFGFTL